MTTMTESFEQTVEARQRLAVAAGAALLLAGLILVMFVLPAEYGIDPLGTGARVRLLDLGVFGQQVEALSSGAANGAGQATIVIPPKVSSCSSHVLNVNVVVQPVRSLIPS
jgi:hypothetical protein